MRLALLFFIILSCFNLLQLLYFGTYEGGKVIVEANFKNIILQIILCIFLVFIYFRINWEGSYKKCPKCKETFDYKDTINGKCPNCKDVDTIDIKEYYEKFPDEKEE